MRARPDDTLALEHRHLAVPGGASQHAVGQDGGVDTTKAMEHGIRTPEHFHASEMANNAPRRGWHWRAEDGAGAGKDHLR